jgi:hypothetical protein
MPGVSKEQIERAREVGLLFYLEEKEPDELIPSGAGKFRTATHSSLSFGTLMGRLTPRK